MKVVLASGNAHKLEEISRVLPRRIRLVTQSELGIESPPETGQTFVENALIKARHASERSGLVAIADDSGLAVHALAGQPGIFSARFAGKDASDAENNSKLLSAMVGIEDRRASFHCVIVMLTSPADPIPLIAQGRLDGAILTESRGTNGFGYDPLFYVEQLERTVAELSASEKDGISHRGQALEVLKRLI
jgi:XTP/dITP diphosphohydrolase